MRRYLILTVLLARATVHLLAATPFEIRNDKEFLAIFTPEAALEKLATGLQFTEGPVWVPRDGGYLVFSDIPANELKKWTRSGGVSLFRFPSKNANGNTLDLKDRVVTAEHTGRRISFLTRKDNLKSVVDEFNGKKFNSPNDVVVKSDGTYWFTDPDYGLPKDATKELEGNFVFRFDEKQKSIRALVTDFDKPNGLCFSPDEKRLYVADSGRPHHIRVFDVQADGTLSNGKIFCVIDPGGPDGIRCDADGRVWSSAGNRVQVFLPDGTLVVKVNFPESAANLCFGGDDGQTLFVTARSSLYAIGTRVKGASRPESKP